MSNSILYEADMYLNATEVHLEENHNIELANHAQDLYDVEEFSEVSCWPFVCASAKKAVHKGLNIEKLTSKPVIRTGGKEKNS